MTIRSGSSPSHFNIPVVNASHAPTAKDTRYDVPTIWLDTSSRHIYMFMGVNVDKQAVWRDLSQAQTSGGGVPADNSVGDNQLQDGAVVTSKIADNAVTEPKIRAGAVLRTKIADGAINTDKLDPALLATINAAGPSTIQVDGANITSLTDSTTIEYLATGMSASPRIVDSSILKTHLSSGLVTEVERKIIYASQNVAELAAGNNVTFDYDSTDDRVTINSAASGTSVTHNSTNVTSINNSTEIEWTLTNGALTGELVDDSITTDKIAAGLLATINKQLQYMNQDVDHIVAGDRITLSYNIPNKTLTIASLGGSGSNSLTVDGLTITTINDSDFIDWTSANAIALANIKDGSIGLPQLSGDVNRRVNPISITATTNWETTTDAIGFALADYEAFGSRPTSTQIRGYTYTRRVNSGTGDIILRINKTLNLSNYRIERIVGTNTAPVDQGVVPTIFAASGFSYRVVPEADDAVYDYWIYTTVPGNPVDSTFVSIRANEHLRVAKMNITYSTPSWTGNFRDILIGDLSSSLQTMITTGGQVNNLVVFDNANQKTTTLNKIRPLTLIDRTVTTTVSSNVPIIWGGDGSSGTEANIFTVTNVETTVGINIFVRDSYVTANPLTSIFIRRTGSGNNRLVWPAQFGSTVMINSVAYRQYPFTNQFLATNGVTLVIGDFLSLERDVVSKELQVQKDVREFNSTLTNRVNSLVVFDDSNQKVDTLRKVAPIKLVDGKQTTVIDANVVWGGDGTTNTTEEANHVVTQTEDTGGINVYIRTSYVTANPNTLFLRIRSAGGTNRRINLPSSPVAVTIITTPYTRYTVGGSSIHQGDTLFLVRDSTDKILEVQKDVGTLEESQAVQNVDISQNKAAIARLSQATGIPVPDVIRQLAPLLTLMSSTTMSNTPWTFVTPNIFNNPALTMTRLFSYLDRANLSSRTITNEFTDISGVRINSSSIGLFYYSNPNSSLNLYFPGRNSFTESRTTIDNNTGMSTISASPLKVLAFSMRILDSRPRAGTTYPLLRLGSSNTQPLLYVEYSDLGGTDRFGIESPAFDLQTYVSRQDGGRRSYTNRVILGGATFSTGGRASLLDVFYFHTTASTPASVTLDIRLFDNDNDLGVQSSTITLPTNRANSGISSNQTFRWSLGAGLASHPQEFTIQYIGDSNESPQTSRSIRVRSTLNNSAYVYVLDVYYNETTTYNAPVTYATDSTFRGLQANTQYDYVATFYRNSTSSNAPIIMSITDGNTIKTVNLNRSAADISFDRLEFLSDHQTSLVISRVQYYSYATEFQHLTHAQLSTAWQHRDNYLGAFLPPSRHSSVTNAVDLSASLDVNAITVNGSPVMTGSVNTSKDSAYSSLTLTRGTPSRTALPSGKTITPAAPERYVWVSAQNTRLVAAKTIMGVEYSFRATQYSVADGTNANISTVMGIRSLSQTEITLLGWIYPGGATTQQRANQTFNTFLGNGNVVISSISPINTPQPIEIWRPNNTSGIFTSVTMVHQTVLGGAGSSLPRFMSVTVSTGDILVVPTNITATTDSTPVEIRMSFGQVANYAYTTAVTAVTAVPGRTVSSTNTVTESLSQYTFDSARQKASFIPKVASSPLVATGIQDKVLSVCWAGRRFEESSFTVNTADSSALYNSFRISIRESDYYKYLNSDNKLNLRLERRRGNVTAILTLPTFTYAGIPSNTVSDENFNKLILEGRYEGLSSENATTQGDVYRLIAHTMETTNADNLVDVVMPNFESTATTAKVPAGSTTTISTPTVRRWAGEELSTGTAASFTKTLTSQTYSIVGSSYDLSLGSDSALVSLLGSRSLTPAEVNHLGFTTASGYTASNSFNIFLGTGTMTFRVNAATIVEVWRPNVATGTIASATRIGRWAAAQNGGTTTISVVANDILVVMHRGELLDTSFVDITFASTGSYAAVRTATAADAVAGSTLVVNTVVTDDVNNLTFDTTRQKRAVVRATELLPTVLRPIEDPIPVAAAWGNQRIESFRFELDDLDPSSYLHNFRISVKASDFNRFLMDDGTVNLRLTRQRSSVTTTLTLPTFRLVSNRRAIFSIDQSEIINEDRFEATSGVTTLRDGDIYRLEAVDV